MLSRTVFLTALLVAGALAGCGPSRAGLEARANARQRLNIVNAELGRDQAVQALKAGQFEKATKEINRSIAMHPTWGEYRVIQGRIFLETHRLERALKAFEMALELRPEYAEAHYYCGIVYQRWSDDARAHDHYRAAFEQEPDQVAYLLASAESLVALDQLNQATHLITAKLSYFENNAALHHLLAQIAMLHDDPALATEMYEEAWRLSSDDDSILGELAHAQYQANLFGECLRSVQQLKDRPGGESAELKRLYARCLVALDRQPEARNLFIELTRDDPTDTELWVELGTVAWEVGDFHRMALCGARATALAPDRFEGYLLKGVNERHHGKLDEAIMFLRQAADRAVTTPLPLLLLGRVHAENGDRQSALDAYAAALRIDPEDETAKLLWSNSQEQILLARPSTGGPLDE
jgi:tetratricopeptide (TPR) repeat protein